MDQQTPVHIKFIEVSKKLFWKHGIKRITVEEICKEATLSKMTFYRYFKNKEDIAKQVMQYVFNQSKLKYMNIMENNDDFRTKVNKLVILKHNDVQGISAEFINEIYQNKTSNLYKTLEDSKKEMQNIVLSDFKKAQENGDIRQDLNLNFIVFMLNDINEKLLDKKLNKMYPNKEALIMELTNFFFYGILH